ncbi:MAG TPA: helix-turn-helix transcriptional regulator [Terriglobales bacterium]|nr:helix-turn-helix transcriptional regulator [Terriglobales bacterium]
MTTVERDFSRRERQIVGALCEAKAVKDIARELDLSVNTVKDYLKTIYRKAQVHSARELMRKMAASEPAPTADSGLALLLHTAQRLSSAAPPAEVLAQLHAAIRGCTRARRVSFWHWLRNGAQLCLAGDPASTRPGPVLRVDGFARQLRERGWARLERHEMGGFEGREFATQGLLGEVIGVACGPTARVQVVLAGDPLEGRFGPLDAPTVRLLVRLIHSSGEHGLVLRATA